MCEYGFGQLTFDKLIIDIYRYDVRRTTPPTTRWSSEYHLLKGVIFVKQIFKWWKWTWILSLLLHCQSCWWCHNEDPEHGIVLFPPKFSTANSTELWWVLNWVVIAGLGNDPIFSIAFNFTTTIYVLLLKFYDWHSNKKFHKSMSPTQGWARRGVQTNISSSKRATSQLHQRFRL